MGQSPGITEMVPPMEKVRTCPKRVQVLHLILSHRILLNGVYICSYTFTIKNQANVGTYTGPLDPMGINPESTNCVLFLNWISPRLSSMIFSRCLFPPQQH